MSLIYIIGTITHQKSHKKDVLNIKILTLEKIDLIFLFVAKLYKKSKYLKIWYQVYLKISKNIIYINA